MSTQTIDFSKYEQQAPAQIDFSKYESAPSESAPETPSAASRFGTNFLSGLGVTSNEQAKHFFAHPLDTVIKSFEAQGELAKKARDAYNRGDYMEALQHGLNYLVPFVGQQTDQAGTQLTHGDISGGVGRTLGAAVPIIAGSPEVRATTGEVASAAASKGAAVLRNVSPKQIAQGTGAVTGAGLGHGVLSVPGAYFGAEGAGKLAEGILGKEFANKPIGLPSRVTGGPASAPRYVAPPEVEPTVFPGAPLPGVPAPEQLNPALVSPARSLPGQISPEVIRPPAAPIPRRSGLALTGEVEPQIMPAAPGPETTPQAAPSAAQSPATVPPDLVHGGRVALSGESALRDTLASLDSADLMKIARSRGINVTQEAQLKPSIAGPRVLNKIVGDFSPEELQDFHDTYLETERMAVERPGIHPSAHDFGDIGSESHRTLTMQTYFPDVNVPLARTLRTQKAINAAARTKFAPQTDLGAAIEEAQQQATPKKTPQAIAKQPPAAAMDDLTDLLQQSLKQAKARKIPRS